MVNLAKIGLDSAASARVLEAAKQARATVIVSSEPDDGITRVESYLIDVHPHALLVRPRRTGTLPRPWSYDGACGCRMLMWPVHYLFAARVLEFRSDLVLLGRPESLTLLERRRSPRTRLARSCEVYLRWDATEGDGRTVGKLLNLSPEGMACRVDLAAAEALGIGDSVEMMLTLRGASEPIELRAVVRSLTPGGSPDTLLLGVEFIAGGMSPMSIRRLRDHVDVHLSANAVPEYVR